MYIDMFYSLRSGVYAYSHKLLNLDVVLIFFTGTSSAVNNKSSIGHGISVVLKIVLSVISFLLILICIYLVLICKLRGRTMDARFLYYYVHVIVSEC
jgi:hypothetical protein